MHSTKCTTISAPLPLDPGTYRLTADVKNPRPDRRANQSRLSNWEHWVQWPENMLFTVSVDPEFNINRIRPQGGISYLSRFDRAFPVLLEYLEPIDERPSDYIMRRGSGLVQHYALGILDRLGIPVEKTG